MNPCHAASSPGATIAPMLSTRRPQKQSCPYRSTSPRLLVVTRYYGTDGHVRLAEVNTLSSRKTRNLTVTIDTVTGVHKVWGVDPLVKEGMISVVALPAPAKKILGFQRPLAILASDGKDS